MPSNLTENTHWLLTLNSPISPASTSANYQSVLCTYEFDRVWGNFVVWFCFLDFTHKRVHTISVFLFVWLISFSIMLFKSSHVVSNSKILFFFLKIILFYLFLLLFSHSVSLRPHGPQDARLPCPSLSPGVCSNSCPLNWWYNLTISSSVVPFFSCPQSFPGSGSFPVSRLFASSGQSIGTSASVLPMNSQS